MPKRKSAPKPVHHPVFALFDPNATPDAVMAAIERVAGSPTILEALGEIATAREQLVVCREYLQSLGEERKAIREALATATTEAEPDHLAALEAIQASIRAWESSVVAWNATIRAYEGDVVEELGRQRPARRRADA